jgi:hypothetical protein
MEDLQDKIIELMDLFDGEVTTLDKINPPEPRKDVQDIEAINRFMRDNPPGMAGGGMLVQPSADGSRPGYAGKKTGLKEKTTVAEGNKLSKQYNKIINTAFNKGDMSKIPSWKSFLENKTLKHGSVGFYQTQAQNFNVINATAKKFELADRLIDEASKTLKYTEWMDIQKKLSSFKDIDTRTWREYIDKNTRINGQAAKVNQAFDYLLDNDIELKIPKNLSKTMAAEGSLLRKVIADLTGAGKARIIDGLNMNDAYNKNIDQIKFANQGNLWTQGEGRTLSEILENADYRMKGNISWTSDIKLSNRANKNVFDYALRNFNYHQLNKTGEGTIQFYDKKTNEPVNWDTLPKNKNGFRVLKPNSVYFIDANDPNRTKWDMTSIDADNLKWSKGTGSSGLFDEVFQAKDIYDNLLSEEVINPKTGKKTSFGKLMKDVYEIGFSNFGNPYAIDHKDGVANKPFKNLRIASQRINSALSALNRDTTLNKFTKDGILKVLKEGTFDPSQKNVIDTIIKGTAPIREDVLVQGTKFDQSELDMAKQKFLTNLDKNKFRRVSKVLVDAAIDGGFGEAVQKICMRKKAKKGGRMFLSNGSGCPAADQDPKGFLKSVSENPVLKKFFTSNAGQKAATTAARVTGNVLNPSTLIGGEVAFVLADGFNNFSKGMDLAESFDRAFIFKDFKQFDKNIMEQAQNLGYDQNQLNLLNETININRLDNRKRALEYGLNNETPGSEDLTMGFTQRLADTKNQLDKSVSNYIGSLDKMGFDLMKDSSYDVGFRYLDNVFKKRTQDQMLKTYDKRKRQVDPTSGTLGNILDPILDVGAYTQPFKFAADVVNPFTKNVPLLSDRQREAKYLREMDPRELYLYNKQRGFTLDDIEAGTSPQIRQVMDQLGGATTGQGFFQQFKKGGRAGFKTGSVRKGVLSLIDESVKKTPKDITSDLTELIKKTLDEDFFDKKDRIIDQLNITAAKKRKNFPYNQKVQEEPDQIEFYDDIAKSNFKTKTGPFFDYQKRKNKAGGGILKQAGDSSGPPPESGPNPQGLQGLLNRVKKI